MTVRRHLANRIASDSAQVMSGLSPSI